MKLIKALNGDMINLDHATAFNVSDFGNRYIVFVRINTQSYELFSVKYDKYLTVFDARKQAEDFLNKLLEEMKSEGTVIKIDQKQFDSHLEIMRSMDTLMRLNSTQIIVEPTVTQTMVAKAEAKRAEQTKNQPAKRAPRKIKETGNE